MLRYGLGAAIVVVAAFSPRLAFAQQDVSAEERDRAGAIISLIDLAETEYVDAVRDGQVINAAEYEEASEFAAEALRRLDALEPAADPHLDRAARDGAARLVAAIRDTTAVSDFSAQAEATASAVAEGWNAVRVRFPGQRPSARRGAVLYRINCAECHGETGLGDGPEGEDLDPPPANLASRTRGHEASLLRDFEVMSFGVPATAMESWQDRLTLQERWDVVAYIQGLRFGAAAVAEGRDRALAEDSPLAGVIREWTDPEEVLEWTDPQYARRVADALGTTTGDAATRSVVAYLRAQTGEPLDGVPETDLAFKADLRLSAIDSLLTASLLAAGAGEREAAMGHAIEAYLEFETLEPLLGARDQGLVREIEAGFAGLRADIAGSTTIPDRTELDASLLNAAEVLKAERPSAVSLAVQSFVIILREGFEAILIIGAIIAFLIKTGHREQRRSVYAGVGTAIAASLVVGIALEALFLAVPARREVLEGATMLVAVAVLFSVSYWLVSKLQHGRWERYLQERMHLALGAGGGMALAGVAFLAVFREGVETVLFYKALNTMAGGSTLPVAVGFIVGLLALVVIYTGFTRLGIRMPMRPFFALTSGILYFMAVVFAGAGVAELQEAGVVAMTPIKGLPTWPGLGIFPTVETVAAQGFLLVLLAAALVVTFVLPRMSRAREIAEAQS